MTTITLPRATVEQALEALEYHVEQTRPIWKTSEAIAALEAALAQQAEPNVEYERGFIDGMQKQAQSSVDKAVNRMAEPGEPVAWKQGNLVTFNEDPYPALGGLFVQFWDGEEVAARVYANDLETIRQRCAKVNTAPPQRKPLPKHDQPCVEVPGYVLMAVRLARAVERAHGIGEGA